MALFHVNVLIIFASLFKKQAGFVAQLDRASHYG